MATYEILIADDHPLFRSALHQALTLGLGPDVRLVEVASIMFMGDGRLAGFVVHLNHHGFFARHVLQQFILQHGDLFRRVVGEGRSGNGQGQGGE